VTTRVFTDLFCTFLNDWLVPGEYRECSQILAERPVVRFAKCMLGKLKLAHLWIMSAVFYSENVLAGVVPRCLRMHC